VSGDRSGQAMQASELNKKMLMQKSKNQRSNGNKLETKASVAKPPRREVGFVLECTGAEHVYVCGDFNDWHPACLRMIGNADDGLWEKRLTLPLGRYEYKFVVDGNWLHDPDARENVSNIFGSLNSVVEVRP
jgi:1,4-alpha-glucan branching enzyme